MLIDTRKSWQRAKRARPSSLPEEDALRRAPIFWMEMDALGILWLVVSTPYKRFRMRYRPQGQDYPDELLEDWLRPGRWRKPTKRQLETLARRKRHPMRGRPDSMECARWEDTYPLARKRGSGL